MSRGGCSRPESSSNRSSF
eukprot:gene26641-biopygen17056